MPLVDWFCRKLLIPPKTPLSIAILSMSDDLSTTMPLMPLRPSSPTIQPCIGRSTISPLKFSRLSVCNLHFARSLDKSPLQSPINIAYLICSVRLPLLKILASVSLSITGSGFDWVLVPVPTTTPVSSTALAKLPEVT